MAEEQNATTAASIKRRYDYEASRHAMETSVYLHGLTDDGRRQWVLSFVYALIVDDDEARLRWTLAGEQGSSPPPVGRELLIALVGEAIMQAAPVGLRGR